MKKVLVTGGSRGIGKAITEKFLEHGYEVTAPTRLELDLLDSESIEKYVQAHKEDGFDIIVNNAGINDIHEIEDITDEEIERMIAINLVAPIKLLRGFTGSMKQKKYGRIVNIGSIWAVVSKGGRCVYSATKNGIHGVTNTLAVELAADNILVNTVCPGFTMTELYLLFKYLRPKELERQAHLCEAAKENFGRLGLKMEHTFRILMTC